MGRHHMYCNLATINGNVSGSAGNIVLHIIFYPFHVIKIFIKFLNGHDRHLDFTKIIVNLDSELQPGNVC